MRRLKESILICLALVGLTAYGAQSDQLTSTVPDIVQRAANEYATELHGVIGMQRHFFTDVYVGPIHRTETSISGYLARDGSYFQIKYYSIVKDGKILPATNVEARDQTDNRGFANGKVFFKEPYDQHFITDYHFEEAAPCERCPDISCPECTANTTIVRFTSDMRDPQHGNGAMWIDQTTNHVLRLTYTPNELPPHATSGTVTEISSEALPNLWCVTHITGVYSGHALLFRGTGKFTGILDHFERFDKVGLANAALQNGSI